MQKITKQFIKLGLFISPALALAAPPITQPTVPNATKANTLGGISQIIADVVTWITGLFFVAAILFLFYAAYLYLSAGGDEEQLKKAKNQLIYSIIAIAIALLAGVVKNIVGDLLGATGGV